MANKATKVTFTKGVVSITVLTWCLRSDETIGRAKAELIGLVDPEFIETAEVCVHA